MLPTTTTTTVTLKTKRVIKQCNVCMCVGECVCLPQSTKGAKSSQEMAPLEKTASKQCSFGFVKPLRERDRKKLARGNSWLSCVRVCASGNSSVYTFPR